MYDKFIILFFSFFFCFLVGCDHNNVIIPKEKMVDIIVDLQMAEATSAFDQVHIRNAEKFPYYNSVCVKHGISRAQLDSSLVYYSKEEVQLKEIYDRVIDRLHVLEAEVERGIFASQLDTFLLGVDSAHLFLASDSSITDSIECEMWHFNRSYSSTDTVNLRFETLLFNREYQRYLFICNYNYRGTEGAEEPIFLCGTENFDSSRKSTSVPLEKGDDREIWIEFESNNLQQVRKLYFEFVDRLYKKQKLDIDIYNIRVYKMHIEGVEVNEKISSRRLDPPFIINR